MRTLIVVKVNGDPSTEAVRHTMEEVEAGFRTGALVLDCSCEVIAFDEEGRMVYPIRPKEGTTSCIY